jgi:hypothetical protein
MSSLFSHKLQFQPVDPLGDGLGEDIARELSDPANLEFQQDIDGQSLTDFWNEVGRNAHNE